MKPDVSAFNPADPHHFSDLGEHHGHHITSWQTLLGVLIALLALTGLTISAAQFETYLIREMGWSLPNWINIAVAMSIATVKALLVISVFMALKYENRLYTIVFLFCVFAFALFLALTGMDLDNRGRVYAWKQESINKGGTGVGVTHPGGTITVHGETITLDVGAFNGSLAESLKNKYIETTGITEEEYWRRWAEANHLHQDHEAPLSSADRTMPRVGLSGALDAHAPEHDAHTPAAPETSGGH